MGFKNWVNEMSPVKMSGDFFEIGNINSNKVFKHNKFDLIKVAKLYYDEVKKEDRWAIIAELYFSIIENLKSDNKIINTSDYEER